jgi:glycosyltransferase involved in cell wall biosynthesis
MKKISIVVPVFNEINTLDQILEKLENTDFCGLEKEIILVDDDSRHDFVLLVFLCGSIIPFSSRVFCD